jgi:transcriptional regulator NrdR family protein
MARKPSRLPVAPAPAQPTPGLSCPKCGCHHLPVVYTRPYGEKTMRRRCCRNCGWRFATFEITDANPLSVVLFKKI